MALRPRRMAANLGLDDIAVPELALEDVEAERVEQKVLDDALQGAGTVNGIVAFFSDVLLGGGAKDEAESLFGKPLADAGELKIHDGGDFLALEAVENDDFIDPIEELGAEMAAQRLGDFGFALFGVLLVEDEL